MKHIRVTYTIQVLVVTMTCLALYVYISNVPHHGRGLDISERRMNRSDRFLSQRHGGKQQNSSTNTMGSSGEILKNDLTTAGMHDHMTMLHNCISARVGYNDDLRFVRKQMKQIFPPLKVS